MKTFIKFLGLLAFLAFFPAPALVWAQDDDGAQVSFQTFYDQLGDQGSWIQTDDYGYVFQPNVNDPEWAPYTDGYWVDSPAGFTWVSDEPWGWATYHYGRWANIDGLGWVWVPGYRWAPAWVSWRYGGGYCGWAPLPPRTLYGAEYEDSGASVNVGFHFGSDVDVSFGIGAGYYNFVRVEDFGDRDYRHHRVRRENNFTIINNTTNITNINVNGGNTTRGRGNRFSEVAAGGPPANEINARSRQRIETVNFTAANQPGRSTLQGNSLAIYAPKVDPASGRQDRPKAVSQTINHPTFNRGDTVTKPLDVTASVKAPPPSPGAIQAAQEAQLHSPSTAKIATPETQPQPALDKPLTSLQPVTQGARHGNQSNADTNNPGARGPNSMNPHFQPNANRAGAPGNTSQNTVTPNNGVNPAATFNSQNQGNGVNGQNENIIHPKTHSQVQDNEPGTQGGGNKPWSGGQGENTFHPQSHSPVQDNGATGQSGDNRPAPSSSAPIFHPQSQGENTFHPHSNSPQDNGMRGQGEGNSSSHEPPSPPFHSQNQGGGGAGAVHPANAPATVAPANSGGNGGGNKPTGNGNKKDKDQGNNPKP